MPLEINEIGVRITLIDEQESDDNTSPCALPSETVADENPVEDDTEDELGRTIF